MLARPRRPIGRSTGRPLRHPLRLLIVAVTAVGLAAGCSSVPSNTPDDYAETIPGGGESTTRADFLEACQAPDGAGADDDYCQCFYDLIVEEIPFDEFESNDEALADDPEDVPPEYEEFADQCLDAGGSPGDSAEGTSEGSTDEGSTTTAGDGTTTVPPATDG